MNYINSFRKAVFIVAILNLLYFFVEFMVALNIRSVSLLADSIDFIEDTSINFLIFFAISLTFLQRAKISIFLSFIMTLPGITALWAIWQQIIYREPPAAVELSVIAFGALVINCTCTLILMKFQDYKGSLTKAAFLSARNDAFANIAIIFTGIITFFLPSIWPDIFVGILIAYIRIESALDIFKQAYSEINSSKQFQKN